MPHGGARRALFVLLLSWVSGLRVEPPARKLLSERARRLVLPDAAVRRRDTAKRRAVLDWASELSSAWAGEPSATGGLAWPTLGPRVRRFALQPIARVA